jgi:hypothetical protein
MTAYTESHTNSIKALKQFKPSTYYVIRITEKYFSAHDLLRKDG